MPNAFGRRELPRRRNSGSPTSENSENANFLELRNAEVQHSPTPIGQGRQRGAAYIVGYYAPGQRENPEVLLGVWGGAKQRPRQSRRPSAAKSIIRAEVPKDTGPIYLQASFFRAAAAGDGVECAGSKILRKLRVSKSQPLATNPRHACDQRVANLTPETPYSPTPRP